MNAQKMYANLRSLDPYETIARKHYNATGEMLDYTYLIYLPKYLHESDPLVAMSTASARSEQAQMKEQFRVNYRMGGLSEHDFFVADRDIDMKTLPRYFQIPVHKHTFIELVYVISGTCTHSIDKFHTTHAAGDFVIVPPGVTHELRPVDDCVCVTTQMRKSAFLDAFSDILQGNSLLSSYFSQVLNLPNYHCALSFHCGDDEFIRHTLLSAYEQQERNQLYSDSLVQALWQVLFGYVLQNYQDTVAFLVSDSIQHGKMVEILNYIFENYQNITLSGAAQHFYFSVPYFSTLIHTQTGKTFSELLKSYKLQRAADLLKQTSLRLDLVCDEVGYKNTAQFIRSFKEAYGCTPGQYRKTHKATLNDAP